MTFCEGLFWRSLACLILSVLGCYSVGVSLFIDLDIFQWICFPCLLHSTSTLLVFIGLTSLPSSEATALYATYPCWALLFTYCIVQEPLGATAFAGIGGSFIGMLLIVQPFAGQQAAGATVDATRATGAALTIIGGMLAGMLAITIRRMGVRVHYLLLSAWMSLYGIVLSLAVPLIQGRGPLAVDGPLQAYAAHSPHFAVCLGLFMLCSCVSLLCLNWALQLENAGSISMVQVGILVSFQYVLDVSMGPTATSLLGVAGILLVLASCFAIYTARTAELGDPSAQPTVDGEYGQLEHGEPIPAARRTDAGCQPEYYLPAPAAARSALVHGERYET
eukprot:CAMPEP_0172187344 /NCGR_PEP_ID=MMETSP1050-20130122/21294_1 /TAXON_ID=233186 /ORGANISM="Cryptomonas curvata, Strain CCAP979/52" /LENGTH=333 /DNA_ID=CAMNT_0012861673 /DNA_START=453 /DNA_END=1454 /DNA_ORIENTATION=-